MLMDVGVAASGLEELGAEEVEEWGGGIRRDYQMEGHLKAIGRWYLWGGSLLALPALFGGIALVFGGGGDEPGGIFQVAVTFVVLVALSALFLSASHFLSRFSDLARIAVLVLNEIALVVNALQIVMLLFAPEMADADPRKIRSKVALSALSFMWYGFVCWTMGSRRCAAVCTPRYREVALRAPGPSGWTSPFFWMPLVLGGFAVVLGAA